MESFDAVSHLSTQENCTSLGRGVVRVSSSMGAIASINFEECPDAPIRFTKTQPAKVALNKKSFPKQKPIQDFTIDDQGFRKTKNRSACTG